MEKFMVVRMGSEDGPHTMMDLQMQVRSGTLKATDFVRKADGGSQFMAQDIPGLFSQKEWMTAVLLSFFLGMVGADRFYLGHTGLGILKLLTCGGAGFWALIDLIMILTNKINDAANLPLRKN